MTVEVCRRLKARLAPSALSPSSGLVTSGDSVSASLTDADNPVTSSEVWQWDRSADGSTNWTTVSGAIRGLVHDHRRRRGQLLARLGDVR